MEDIIVNNHLSLKQISMLVHVTRNLDPRLPLPRLALLSPGPDTRENCAKLHQERVDHVLIYPGSSIEHPAQENSADLKQIKPPGLI